MSEDQLPATLTSEDDQTAEGTKLREHLLRLGKHRVSPLMGSIRRTSSCRLVKYRMCHLTVAQCILFLKKICSHVRGGHLIGLGKYVV
jgi:hypothetical protein